MHPLFANPQANVGPAAPLTITLTYSSPSCNFGTYISNVHSESSQNGLDTLTATCARAGSPPPIQICCLLLHLKGLESLFSHSPFQSNDECGPYQECASDLLSSLGSGSVKTFLEISESGEPPPVKDESDAKRFTLWVYDPFRKTSRACFLFAWWWRTSPWKKVEVTVFGIPFSGPPLDGTGLLNLNGLLFALWYSKHAIHASRGSVFFVFCSNKKLPP